MLNIKFENHFKETLKLKVRTKKSLSEATGISPARLTLFETDISSMTYEDAVKLSLALNMKPEQIFPHKEVL